MPIPVQQDIIGHTYRDAWQAAGGALKQKTPKGLESILENLGIDEHAIVSSADEAWWVLAAASTYEPNSVHMAEASDVFGGGRFVFPVPVYLEREEKPGLLQRLRENHPYLYKGLVVATVIGTMGLAAAAGFTIVKHAGAQNETECDASIHNVRIDKDFNESRLINDWERLSVKVQYQEELSCDFLGWDVSIKVVSDNNTLDTYHSGMTTFVKKGAHNMSAAAILPMGQTFKLIISKTLWQASGQPNITVNYVTDVFVPYPDKVVKWAINNAPTLRFDSREKHFPTDPYGDGDADVSNNPGNWPQKFSGRPVIFYSITDSALYLSDDATVHPEDYKDILESKVYVQYWAHYVWNEWRGTDKHRLDNELIVKEVDRQTGEVTRTSMSMHIWNNVYDGNVSTAYVENGSHGMSKDGKSFFLEDFSTVGITLTPDDYEIKPLSVMGKYYKQDFPGERGRFPGAQERHSHPEIAFQAFNLPNSMKFSIQDSPNLELVLKNPNVAAVQQGETVYAANNIGEGFLNGIEFKTTGVREENYRAKVEVGYRNGTKNAEVVLSIKPDQSQYFQANESGLELDKDGDGIKETHIQYSSGQPASPPGLLEKILVACTAAGGAIAGIFGFRRWHRKRKSL
ncbi:MAG: hypothetical protein HYT16_01820 [DPANN group archaeon]|nr:hypothetical protein [DPANN group archaeon]